MYETLTGKSPFDGDNLTAIMYATANTHPAPPSTLNQAAPKMLDLMLEKALAKDVERRYQSMREVCNDLREVRRLLVGGTGSRPMPRLDSLLAPKPAAAPAAGSATGPMTGHQRKFEEDDVAGQPLKISKQFDSFSATAKLAAMTQQTAEFREWITETQKMRAFTGAAPLPAPTPAAIPLPPPPAAPASPRAVSIPRGDITGSQRMQAYGGLPVLPILILTTLALGVIGLLVAALVR
jgi:serine/threonine-protein kinase